MSDAEPRWMTYRELADELGISHRAAEARARRQVRAGRWRHRNDNDALKTARVLVPPADIEAMQQDTAGDTVPDTSGGAVPVTPGDTAEVTDPHGISLLLDALKASHERELDGLKAAHARELAARDELAGELRQQRDTERTGRESAEAEAARIKAELARALAEPGMAKALRQGRAMLAGWIGGRKS
jgi:hypothetical protein